MRNGRRGMVDINDGNSLSALINKLMEIYDLSESQARSIVDSKAVKKVLEALGQASGLLEESIQGMQKQLAFERDKLHEWNFQLKSQESDLKQREDALEAEKQNLETTRKALEELETDEAKDRVRMAKFFESLVNIETPQNNTAYIAGVGSILAGAPIWKFEPQNSIVDSEDPRDNESRRKGVLRLRGKGDRI